MRRLPAKVLLAGALVVVVGIPLQAFSIVAYVRGAGESALDMHRIIGDIVHLGELAVVIGATWAWWGRWREVALAVAFLAVAVAQVLLIGDTDERGGWVNGLHGLFALVLFVAAILYAQQAARILGRGDAAARS